MALDRIKTVGIQDDAITSAKIGVDVIAAEDLAANSITVSEITDGAVTSAKLDTNIAVTGTLSSGSSMTATGEFKANGGAVFNEDSADVDFRVESNGNANMLFVDGGNDRVGVGLSSPDTAFHVQSTSQLPQAKVSYDSTRSVSFGHSSIIQTSGASQDNSFSIHSRGFHSGSGNVIKFFTGGQSDGTGETEKLRILSGGGITFNGDTAAANALDDYEEGTYTPTLYSNGATFSYSVQLGSYIKIGNLVYLQFNITLSNRTGTLTNTVFLDNVPFNTKNVDNSLYSGGHIGHYFNVNLGSGTTMAYQIPAVSTNQIELKEVGDNLGENGIVASELNTNAVIRGSVMYRSV